MGAATERGTAGEWEVDPDRDMATQKEQPGMAVHQVQTAHADVSPVVMRARPERTDAAHDAASVVPRQFQRCEARDDFLMPLPTLCGRRVYTRQRGDQKECCMANTAVDTYRIAE